MKKIAVVACAAGLTLAVQGSFAAPERSASSPCTTGGLVIWLNTSGNGAAGTVYYKLKFTNLSDHKCTLFGFPGVSAVDLHGHRLGRPAARNRPPSPHLVTLARGATRSANLGIVQVANFQNSKCHRTTAAGLRVYPPRQRKAKIVPFPFRACSRSGPIYLTIGAVR